MAMIQLVPPTADGDRKAVSFESSGYVYKIGLYCYLY